MTFESWWCVAGIILSFVVAKDICLHYCAFLVGNLVMISSGLYDSTYLAIGFALLALADAVIGLYSGRVVLLCSAVVSIMLAFEQLANLDTLLSNMVYVDACLTAWIALILAKEWRSWWALKRLYS